MFWAVKINYTMTDLKDQKSSKDYAPFGVRINDFTDGENVYRIMR